MTIRPVEEPKSNDDAAWKRDVMRAIQELADLRETDRSDIDRIDRRVN